MWPKFPDTCGKEKENLKTWKLAKFIQNFIFGIFYSNPFGKIKYKTGVDALSPLLFNFVLEHPINSLEEKERLQLNGINKLLVYEDDVLLLGDNEEILRANTHTLLSNTKKLGLEVNINRTKYMVTDSIFII